MTLTFIGALRRCSACCVEGLPAIAQEETDGGDASGSDGEAGGGVFGCDSAEGEDGDGFCGFGGGVEGVEAATGKQIFAGYGFFEDGRIEDERVGGGGVRVSLGFFFGFEDFFEGVAGMAEDGIASGCGEEVAGLFGGV